MLLKIIWFYIYLIFIVLVNVYLFLRKCIILLVCIYIYHSIYTFYTSTPFTFWLHYLSIEALTLIGQGITYNFIINVKKKMTLQWVACTLIHQGDVRGWKKHSVQAWHVRSAVWQPLKLVDFLEIIVIRNCAWSIYLLSAFLYIYLHIQF